MLTIIETTSFRRDIKRQQKRHKDLQKLSDIVYNLAHNVPLDSKHRPHQLVGDWKPKWECHIENDWLLIYQIINDDELHLIRTGTHSDLFK